jgi:hypothetical protein
MNEKSTWQEIMEEEVGEAEWMEKRLSETGLDKNTQLIIKERTLLRLQQEMIDSH